MGNQIFIWIVLFIGMAGTLYGAAKGNAHLGAVANESVAVWDYFKDNAILVVGSLLVFASIVAGVNLGDEVIQVDTGGLLAALITGAGIPATVKRWILPIFGITGDAAREKLRDAIDAKTNKLDEYIAADKN